MRNNLKTDDVLKRMNLTREQGAINFITLKDSLKELNEDLNDYKASKLARAMLGKAETIEINDLVNILECIEDGK